MGKKFTPGGKNSRAWIIVLGVILVSVIGGLGFVFFDDMVSVYQSFVSDSGEVTSPAQPLQQVPDQNVVDTLTTPADNTPDQPQTDTDNEPPNQPENDQPIVLGDTLTVTVYAAYGQLEPIRVTSDFNWRTNPFWMEQGEAYYFDFMDTLLVRGQYSRLLLMFNGHVIENPRQNYFSPEFNSIMITRNILNQPQYTTPAPREFPLQVGPPDSVVYRIRF